MRTSCAIVVAAAGATLIAAAPAPESPRTEKKPERLVQAEPPPFTEGIFPCTQCHAAGQPVDRTRRALGFHDEIQAAFDHDAEHRWCLDCHDAAQRDVLHLSNGDPVPFTESYRLCGQCHGDKYRDWRVGVHGKRIGMWDGAKTYFLCVNCHNPHSPRFKGVTEIVREGKVATAPTLSFIKPEPRPRRPEEQRR
jgi:hypothetical protein